jgi:hypothetical protein
MNEMCRNIKFYNYKSAVKSQGMRNRHLAP